MLVGGSMEVTRKICIDKGQRSKLTCGIEISRDVWPRRCSDEFSAELANSQRVFVDAWWLFDRLDLGSLRLRLKFEDLLTNHNSSVTLSAEAELLNFGKSGRARI